MWPCGGCDRGRQASDVHLDLPAGGASRIRMANEAPRFDGSVACVGHLFLPREAGVLGQNSSEQAGAAGEVVLNLDIAPADEEIPNGE